MSETNKIQVSKIQNIYSYFDFPVSFTFQRHDKEGLYYANWVGFDKTGDVFWVNEITLQQEVGAINKEFDLRRLMTVANRVEIINDSGDITEYILEEAIEIYKDRMPPAGVYLDS